MSWMKTLGLESSKTFQTFWLIFVSESVIWSRERTDAVHLEQLSNDQRVPVTWFNLHQEIFKSSSKKKRATTGNALSGGIDWIERHFLRLCRDLAVLVADTSQKIEDFEYSWKAFGHYYKLMRWFCGVLASVFSGTATAESKISVLNYEVNFAGTNLSKFSLAGILHSKQYETVRRIHFSWFISYESYSPNQPGMKPIQSHCIAKSTLLATWDRKVRKIYCPNLLECTFPAAPNIGRFGISEILQIYRGLKIIE